VFSVFQIYGYWGDSQDFFLFTFLAKVHGAAIGKAMQGIYKQVNAKYLSNNYCLFCTMVHNAGCPV